MIAALFIGAAFVGSVTIAYFVGKESEKISQVLAANVVDLEDHRLSKSVERHPAGGTS